MCPLNFFLKINQLKVRHAPFIYTTDRLEFYQMKDEQKWVYIVHYTLHNKLVSSKRKFFTLLCVLNNMNTFSMEE